MKAQSIKIGEAIKIIYIHRQGFFLHRAWGATSTEILESYPFFQFPHVMYNI